jgi:YggT family protein
MFGEIAQFLIDIIFPLFGAILVLRAWMRAVGMPLNNQLARGVFQATDWLVLPLRKILPGTGKVDMASLVATWLTAVLYLVVSVALLDGNPMILFPIGLVIAVLTAIKWALNLLIWISILMAVLSWVNPRAEVMPMLYYLTEPFLTPLRRVLPRLGGFDLSPLALFIIAQILLIVVARLGAVL